MTTDEGKNLVFSRLATKEFPEEAEIVEAVRGPLHAYSCMQVFDTVLRARTARRSVSCWRILAASHPLIPAAKTRSARRSTPRRTSRLLRLTASWLCVLRVICC